MSKELEQIKGSVTLHTGVVFAVAKTLYPDGDKFTVSLTSSGTPATDEEVQRMNKMIMRIRGA